MLFEFTFSKSLLFEIYFNEKVCLLKFTSMKKFAFWNLLFEKVCFLILFNKKSFWKFALSFQRPYPWFTLIMAVQINRPVWPVIWDEAAADYHFLYSLRISEWTFFLISTFFLLWIQNKILFPVGIAFIFCKDMLMVKWMYIACLHKYH